MKSNFKRILTLALALVMVLAMAPAAFAEAPADLPTATVSAIQDGNMTFALSFVADEATEEQLAKYGGWYADYVLSMNTAATFNANGEADGYLAGRYENWEGNAWVKVPFENVELAANTQFKILQYAQDLMGGSDKLTYKTVYEKVQKFDCGIVFSEDYLAAHPELAVTVELRIYNPEDTAESYRIGEAHTFKIDTPALPIATVTELDVADLTYALNFVADKPTDAQLAYYGPWHADYVLTVNKDVALNANGEAEGYLAGSYDAYEEGKWVKLPFETVAVKANQPFRILQYAESLMGGSDVLTYKTVYEKVQEFRCGAFFSEEFLAAEENKDLEVTLELRLYNPADTSKSYVVGTPFTFTADTDAAGEDLQDALDAAADEVADGDVTEKVVELAGNASLPTDRVESEEGVVLDLNGFELTAKGGNFYGDVVDNSVDKSGLLKIPMDNAGRTFKTDNAQLPVYTGNGYKFFNVDKIKTGKQGANVYAFKPYFDEAAHEYLLAGTPTSGIKMIVEVTWDGGSATFPFELEHVQDYINSYADGDYTRFFTLTITTPEELQTLQNVKFTAKVVSTAGTEFVKVYN